MVVVVVIEGRWDGGVVSNLYDGCGGYRGKGSSGVSVVVVVASVGVV
jgi:hypothetical protein